MKYLISIIAALTLFSCKNSVGDDHSVKSNGITYFKDTTTNLCYGKIQSPTYSGFNVASIACVPCDSLKRIGLK